MFNIVLVISIFSLTLALTNVSPFGEMVLGKSDALVQYKPMLYNFIMSIKTGSLELFSFNNGLGNSFLFNFVYYLLSPFNLIALLFKDADLMFLSVVLLKISIASITMTFYSKKKGASNFVTCIAVLSYVYCGWFLAYWYNIMWLDTFALFPLFQYGLEKLLQKNKCLVYIFLLALVYVTNFYQAFSVIIYSIVYFLIYNFFYQKTSLIEKLKTFILYLASTFISILLIYVYIYTLVIVKRQMGLGFSDVSEASYIVSSIDFIKSIFFGTVVVTTEKVGHTFPNLCVTPIALIGAISFFFNNKISIKDRTFAFVGLFLFVCCIFFKYFDYVMHMFHNVIGLTYRYSYIMSFFVIVLFIKNANSLEFNKKKLYIILLALSGLLAICSNSLEFNILVINIASLIICGVLVYFYANNKIFKFMILLLLSIQILIVTSWNISFDLEKSYEGEKNNYQSENFKYRINSITGNDYLNQNLYYNENVLYLFTSMSYNNVLNMVPSLGCNSGANAMSCDSNNKIVNMIFNVENEYYLEKIFSVNDSIENVILNNNVKASLEDLIRNMTGIEDIFDVTTLEGILKEDGKYYYTTDFDFYFIDFENENGEIENFAQNYKEFISENNNSSVNIYTVNEEKLVEIYDYLSKNQIKYTYYSDSLMEGEIEVFDNQIIFTSIPYDEAWHVYIDDQEVQTTKTLDEALLAIKCDSGKHKIRLEYKVPYKKAFTISLVVFIILVFYSIFKVYRNKIKA